MRKFTWRINRVRYYPYLSVSASPRYLLPLSLVYKQFLRANKAIALYGLLLASVVACQSSTTNSQPAKTSESRLDTQLLLNNAVLQQSNKQDNTVWKIKADNIAYSENRQTATLDGIVGNLLQNGTVILKLSAKTGKVFNDGNSILLEEDIIVRDTRNGSVITSKAVEWQPRKNLLLIKEELSGIRANLQITAGSGRYFTDTERLEIEDDVVATTAQPALQLKSDRLVWNISGESIASPGAVEIIRYNDERTITDRLVSDRAEVNLADKSAVLEQNVELVTSKPRLQVATDYLTWNYLERVGRTNRPIQIIDRDRQIGLTGNRGEVDLIQQIAKLDNGVRGINQQEISELYARQLTWNMDTEEVEAIGDVVYEQADPPASLTGDKAKGTITNNKIVVTSNGKQQVTTVIEN